VPARGSEAEVSAVGATTRLRLELLRSAVVYGVHSTLSENNDVLVQEWLAYLGWVEGLLSAAATEAGLSADVVQTSEWLDQMTHVLEHPQEGGNSDPFADQEMRGWARVQFECLAERARPLEELATEPLGEVEGVIARDGLRLLAAVQDSLVLASFEDPEIRSQRADAVEMLADLVAARDEGVWDFVFGGWSERKAERVTVTNQRLKTRGSEIVQLLLPTVGAAARVYSELSPDGRELSESEAAAAQAQLLAITTCLRSIQPDADVIEAFALTGRRRSRDADLRPTISVMKMMQRGYGLALSNDPDRRAQAITIRELGPFLVPVRDFWASRYKRVASA
jgi:hypothetical protein